MGPMAMAALGIGTGLLDDIKQLGMQDYFNRQQLANNKHLMNYQFQKQLEMWQKTGYVGQAEQLRKAGLNPALIYGMGGAGGTMAPGTTAVVPGAQAGKGHNDVAQMIGMGIQNKLAESTIKLQESQAKLNEAQATKTSGPDTGKVLAETDNIMQGLDNLREDWVIKRLQQTMMNIDNYEKQASQADRLKSIEYNAHQALNTLEILKNEHQISDATIQEKIEIIRQHAIEAALRNHLTAAQTKLTDQQITKLAEDIKQGWAKIAIETRGMSQKDRELNIKQFEANIKAQYPTIWQVGGHTLTNMEDLLNRLFHESTLPKIK